MSGCSEWATDFKRHQIFLHATGPDVATAVQGYLKSALDDALVAAVGAAVATPGEVAIKATAAVAAFKIAIMASLSGRPLLDGVADKTKIEVVENSHW